MNRKQLAITAILLTLAIILLGRTVSQTATPLPETLPLEEQRAIQNTLSQLPLYFIENQGQLDERVAYYVQGSDTTVYFTATGVTIAQTAPTVPPSFRGVFDEEPLRPGNPGFLTSQTAFASVLSEAEGMRMKSDAVDAAAEAQRWSVKLAFVGANPNVQPIGEGQTEAIISYFKGQPDEWHTGLPTYSRVVYPDLWPGIDLVYEGSASQLKYTFIVQPGADPAQIRLAYQGATEVTVNAAGQMEVKTPIGGFTDDTPVAYQETDGERVPVAMAYVLDEATVDNARRPFHTGKAIMVTEKRLFGFHIGDYDATLLLILDPVILLYAGYIGGSNWEAGYGIAVDGEGTAYVTGYTGSTEDTFPVLVGPDLVYNGGNTDAFVAKVNSSGDSLVYAGYIGGSGLDVGIGIAVDGAGNAYVTGTTLSTEDTFPVLVGPDLTYNGGGDAFVAKVSSDGVSLLYAGYIGGSDWDDGSGITVDGAGNAYVTGTTGSTEDTFPVLVGPDLVYNGGWDAFVAKVSSDGVSLLYAGYIGGSNWEAGYGIAVDGAGNAYVTGYTESTEATFPVLVGPDLVYNEGGDAFVAKVNSSGVSLVYAGYIGGSDSDGGNGITVDGAGNAYVTGTTNSTEATFPVLVGPDLVYNGGYDGFVAKVNSSGVSLVYAGYIGGSGEEYGNGIAVDGAGNAYVTGYTESTEDTFPVLVGPDLVYNEGGDAFVAKVNSSGVSLVYAGYIGGSGSDGGYGIAVDGAGNAYVTGYTYSTEDTFPVLVGPDLTHNGNGDAFVAKVVADDVSPTSSASSPAYANATPISISWSASDDNSGVSSTTLWVKYGSGGLWTATTLSQPGTSGNFAYTPANGDGTYYFATVATDFAGNVESLPTGSGDASTIYDMIAPSSSASSPAFSAISPINVSWSASDATSGVNTTAMWVKFGSGGMWDATGLSQPGSSGVFNYVPTSGYGVYYFATVATDNAGNVEATPSGTGDSSTIYGTPPKIFLPAILNN